jgi:hypothetical protein
MKAKMLDKNIYLYIMSKNLFNQNTFGSKNVINDDDLSAQNIKAVNLVVTGTLTNAELQNATLNISNNTAEIATKQDIITAGDGLSFAGTTLNAEVTQAELDAKQDIITAGDGLSFAGTTLNAEVTQAELDAKQDTLTFNAPSSNNSNPSTSAQIQTALNGKEDTLTFNAPSSNNSNPSTSAQIQTALNGKQDTLTTGEGIDIADLLSAISFDGSSLTGNILTTGSITANTLNYVSSGVTNNVETKINSKQDTLTQSTGITINQDENTISFSGGDIGSINITTTGTITSVNLTGITFSGTTTTIDNSLIVNKGLTSKVMIFNDTGTNFDSSITSTGEFGQDAYFDKFASSGSQHIVGNDFGSMTDGIFTFSSAGTYKIEAQLTAVCNSTNYSNLDRHSFGLYISLNNENANRVPFKMLGLDQAYRKGSIGVFYLRDDTDGVGGSTFLSQYLEINAADTIRLKTLIDDSDGNSQFDNSLANNTLNCSVCLTITLISTSAIIS